MKYAPILIALSIACTALAPLSVGSAPGEDLSAALDRRISNYDLGEVSLVGALVRVSNDFKIPMGIAWVDSPAARSRVPLTWKKATIRDVLRAIANTQSGYELRMNDGVVHAFPRIPDEQNFLKIKVREFEVDNQYAELAYFQLRTLLMPREHGNRQISVAGPGDSRVTIKTANSSVEGILDALCIASNRKIWIVTFSDDPRLTERGLRRSISLWSAKPTDEEQPHWDLLKWGEPLPSIADGN